MQVKKKTRGTKIVFNVKVSPEKKKEILGMLLPAFQKWLRILHLEDWEITLKLVPPNSLGDNIADVDANHTYMFAIIRMDISAPPEQYEQIICHELLHLIIGHITVYLNWLFGERISEFEWRFISEHEETIVEKLSRILTELAKKTAPSAPS